MIPNHPPTFSINYGAVHSRCGNTLKKSDYRIQSYESLSLMGQQDGTYQPLEIYCNNCRATISATTVDVWIFENLSAKEIFYEVPIDELLSQRLKLDVEYKEGLKRSR